MSEDLVYVTRRDHVSRLSALSRENPGYRFVAANKSVYRLIEEAGIEPINPETTQSETTQKEALAKVLTTTDAICHWLEKQECEPGAVSMIRQILLFEINSHERFAGIVDSHQGNVSVLGGGGIVPLAGYFGVEAPIHNWPAGTTTRADTPLPFLPVLNAFNAPFVLEMRAPKRLKGQTADMPRFVRLEARYDRSFVKAVVRNIPQGIRAMFDRGKASRALMIVSEPVVDAGLEAELAVLSVPQSEHQPIMPVIAKLVARAIAEFDVNKRAIDKFFDHYQSNLVHIACDSSGRPFGNAMALAARERGIPLTLESHGCIAVYGTEPRRRAAEVMSDGSFNWGPDIGIIVPHSPVQTLGAPAEKNVVKVNNISVSDATNSDASSRPFRILYAPNFIRWHRAIMALHSTCYETHDIASAIAAAAARNKQWQLDIRIKVTISDKPTQKEMVRDRGLLPRDIEPLINLAPNIRNSSADSYSQNLLDADLVVTEGMTAVMLEALDYRTPVLLFNRDPARTPSMPAWRLDDLQRSEHRSAVYATSLGEDFEYLINRIAQLHHGQPLTDDELRDYCWVDQPAGQPHYLNALLK